MNYLDELKKVILHGSDAVYVETVPVKEVFQGETVWDGEVEVFDLSDNPSASRVFAWAYDFDDTDKPTQHLTVLRYRPLLHRKTRSRRQLSRNTRGKMSETTKPKRRGRPPLPKKEAKSNYVPLRLSDADVKEFHKAMKKSEHKTLSGWIRQTLREAIES